MQKLSGLRRLEGFRSIVRSTLTGMKAANPKPSSDAGGSSYGSFANLKITAEKLVREQSSVKTDLEMAHTKLRRATEQISLLEGKLQQPVNENAKVKQNEDSKLWQGLDLKISSTKTLCDQLTETLQQLASQTEQAEEDKKFFEGMLGKNSKALDEFNCLLHDLSTKLECAEQKIISGKQEMLQNIEEKEEIDRSYKELYSNDMIKEKDSLIKQLEGSVDEIKSLLQLMEQELKLKDDVCISLKENVAGSASEQNNLDLRNQGCTLEIEKLCKDNKDLNKFLSSFMAKVTELDKEHASMPSHVSRLLCSFERFYEMAQEKTKRQLNKAKEQYNLMIEGKQLDLQKYLKDLSLRNEQVITCICKKYELDGIEITIDERQKPEKFIRQMENNCNEMHCKGEHGTMVERIQQDNEYKESRLWTYHKEEFQRIRSYIENGLRVVSKKFH